MKSLTAANEERQLRLALGQVQRYAQLLELPGRTVVPIIATEVEPTDPDWAKLCADLGVVLTWPERFATTIVERR